MLWKKKPILLLTMYKVSLRTIARMRNKNNPTHTNRTILKGGITDAGSIILPTVVGSVEL
jgi:hypothetical protein